MHYPGWELTYLVIWGCDLKVWTRHYHRHEIRRVNVWLATHFNLCLFGFRIVSCNCETPLITVLVYWIVKAKTSYYNRLILDTGCCHLVVIDYKSSITDQLWTVNVHARAGAGIHLVHIETWHVIVEVGNCDLYAPGFTWSHCSKWRKLHNQWVVVIVAQLIRRASYWNRRVGHTCNQNVFRLSIIWSSGELCAACIVVGLKCNSKWLSWEGRVKIADWQREHNTWWFGGRNRWESKLKRVSSSSF